MSLKTLRLVVIVSVSYVAAQIFADISSLRIIMLLGFSVDAGTLVYPLTFTLRDMVHKLVGAAIARTLIILAAVINLFMALLFWVVSVLPADLAVGPQVEFGAVLAPVFRIVLASIIAEVVAELIDTEVYERWVSRFGERYQWGRVLSSNAVSVPIDSMLFVLIAFVGTMPASVAWSIFWVNVVAKVTVSILSIPGIYLVPTPRQPLADDVAS